MTEQEAYDDLMSANCKGCGGKKSPRKSFCGTCYRALPGKLKTDLYKLIGDGYEQAYGDSLRHLRPDSAAAAASSRGG